MKLTTKEKIINKSLELFNKNGFASVSLFEIAGSLDMTRGNLAYHFKDKDVLLQAITDELWKLIREQRGQTRQFPSFENLHKQLQFLFDLQKKFAFIFLDYRVLSHPAVHDRFKLLIDEQIAETEATIAFSISIGNMQPEPYKGIYKNLAFNTWMISFYWLSQQKVREYKDENYSMHIWSMLIPFLTKKGLEAFRGYFGEDYIEEMGQSSAHKIESYTGF